MINDLLASSSSKICVIAAPGSGKTKRILIPKAAQILADQSINPKDVLLLTFSRLSAKDLKERVSSMEERAPRASTVHSLCLAFLLSENSHGMRYRVESILLDFEEEALLSDLKLIFPGISKPNLKKSLEAFSAGWAIRPHDEVFEEDTEQQNFKAAVVNWLSEHEAAMMEEIVYGAVDLAHSLGSSDFIREPQYILVDEYQDLNRLEQEFIKILAAESKLLLVVGDPNQSIYGFKFSYPNGILDFAASPDVKSWNSLITGRCPRKIVEIANQLLLQADPTCTDLLEALGSEDGELHFVQKENQEAEFEHVLRSIASRLNAGSEPGSITVLVPKKKLGSDFVEYANEKRVGVGISESQKFVFESKRKLTEIEQERILRFALLIKPDSLLHWRSYLGLGGQNARSSEIKALKNRYGNLKTSIERADLEDFPARNTRVRKLCERIMELKGFLVSHNPDDVLDDVLNEMFPADHDETKRIRGVLEELREEDDTLKTLYTKFVDYMRAVPTDSSSIRVMTLMASKGLEAEHVYILGCNAGNIPGSKRLSHMTEHEHKQEQRRLLFVGVTRSKLSLTISWARHIPFGQAMNQHTQGIGIRRRGSQALTVVGISEFLQDLNGIVWEH